MNYYFLEYVLQISAPDSWSHSENASCGSATKENELFSNEVASCLKFRKNTKKILCHFASTFLMWLIRFIEIGKRILCLKEWKCFLMRLHSRKLAFILL